MTFGIKNSPTASLQFEHLSMISSQEIPTGKKSEIFNYLGESFNFGMDLHHVKVELESKLEKRLNEFDRLPLKPRDRTRIVKPYFYWKIDSEF